MSALVLFVLAGLVALFSAAVFPAAAQSGAPHNNQSQVESPKPRAGRAVAPPSIPEAQSGAFTVSQLGHAVGTAEFHITPNASGFDSRSTIRVNMPGLDYAVSKTEQLDPARRLLHVMLSAAINGQAVNISGKQDGEKFLLNISANGRSSTSQLAGHAGAVLLPDFDPGALETLLTVAAVQNNRGLWAILPKQTGSIEPVQLATYADEQGTLDGKPVTVHHLVATIAGANTDLFSGLGNGLLQAELPQQGFSLVRKGFVLTPPKRPGAPPQ